METYSNSIRDNRGIAMIYVIASILVVGVVGTITIKMASRDVIDGALLHRATESRFAAKSGIQRLQQEIDVKPDSFLTMIEFLVAQDTADYWIYGNEKEWDSISPTQKYRLKAVDFDTTKDILEVISYGEGNDGKKKVRALLELFHLSIESSVAKVSGTDKHFALYVGEVDQFPMNGPIDIDGNVRFPGNVGFDQLASNSRFRGTFRTSEALGTQKWQGSYIFDSTTYFGTRVFHDGGASMRLNGLTGYEDGTEAVGTNSVTYFDDVFINGTVLGSNGALSLNANNKTVAYGSSFAFSSADWTNYSDGKTTTESPRWVKDSLKMGEPCVPVVDVDVIPGSKKISWNAVRNPGGYGYSGPLNYDPDDDPYVMDQIMANEIYQYALDSGKTWNGIAVLNVDANMSTKRGIPNIEYDSADVFLEGKVESNSDAEFLMSFKDTIYAHESPTYESHRLTSSKPYSEGLTWGALKFDDIPDNFKNATLSIEFYDLDVLKDSYTRHTLQESAELLDADGNTLFVLDSLHPEAARFSSKQNVQLLTPLPDSIFKSDTLELTLKMKCWVKLKSGYSYNDCGNGIDKFFNIRIEGEIDTAAATDTSIAVHSPTFNGKMILLVNDGKKLQPTTDGQFFTIDSSANMMVYGAPGSSIQNIGDWEFFRGYMHIDSGATVSMGGSSNKVDPLMGAIHFSDSANITGWYPLNAGVPNIVYDSAVISEMNHDGLMTYSCGSDSVSGAPVITVTVDPVEGEANQRLLSIRY